MTVLRCVSRRDNRNRYQKNSDANPVVGQGPTTRAAPFTSDRTPEKRGDDVDGHEDGPADDSSQRAEYSGTDPVNDRATEPQQPHGEPERPVGECISIVECRPSTILVQQI